MMSVLGLTILAAAVAFQPRDSPSCQSNIVSSTVVATFCGHRQADNEILDLLILWRGKPGWFQRRNSGGRSGGGGSRMSGGGTNGVISVHQFFGDITIAFDADFDANVATIGQSTVKLDRTNTVVIDDTDGDRHTSATRWIEPHLPLLGDWNASVAQRSPEMLQDLRCDVPMPTPSRADSPRPAPVITVCEKLKKQ